MKRAVTARAVAARCRFLFLATLPLAVLLPGCARETAVPISRPQVETEQTRTVVVPSAPPSVPVGADASWTTAPSPDQVPVDFASDRDLVRDELPGYSAGALAKEPYVLRREYVPADKTVHDRLTVTVRRFRDKASAVREIEALTAMPGTTGVEEAQAAGLQGYSFVQGDELTLALTDAGLILELRLRPAPAADRRRALADVAEALLD